MENQDTRMTITSPEGKTSYPKVSVEMRTNSIQSMDMTHMNHKINGIELHLNLVSSLKTLQQGIKLIKDTVLLSQILK